MDTAGIVKVSEIADFLKEILKIPSIGDKETEVAEKVIEVLEREGITTYELIESEPGRGNLLIKIKGREEKGRKLMIIGHSDVVPAGEGWSVDPFKGVEKDGYIYGRGAIDNKGQVAVMTYLAILLKRLGNPFRGELRLLIAADEEKQDPNHGVRFLIRNRRDIFSDIDGAIGELGGMVELSEKKRQLIVIGEKGATALEIVFRGKSGHSSISYNSSNPIDYMIKFLNNVPNSVFFISKPVKEIFKQLLGLKSMFITNKLLNKLVLAKIRKSNPLLAQAIHALTHVTITKTKVNGGMADNVIPDEVKVTVNARIFPEQRLEDIISLIKRYSNGIPNVKIIPKAWIPATYSETDTELFRACVKTVKEMNYEPLIFFNTGSSDSSWLRSLGIPVYHVFTTKSPIEVYRIHGTDERIHEEDLINALIGYYKLVKNFLR